ncbi:MAG: hypothetical protein WCZ90_20390 [Melioribacteraceae bacterium]
MDNIFINGFFAIIGTLLGYFIATRKYAFEKIYNERLICLKELYKKIVELEFALKKYLHFEGANMSKESINKRIEALNSVENDFQEFQHKYWKEEIILDDNTVKNVDEFLSKYIQITSKLTVSNIQHQQGDYQLSFDNWDKSFKEADKDLKEIKNNLKIEFRKVLGIKSWKKYFKILTGS